MPPAKAKSAAIDGASKTKSAKNSRSNSGTSTPVFSPPSLDTSEVTSTQTTGLGKPDRPTYDAEQDKIKAEIDALQVKLSAVKDKISLTTKSGPGNDQRSALRTELEGIRAQQSEMKIARSGILDDLKARQDNMQKKSKDLQTAKSKANFKTVADVDTYIKNLEKQIESGTMVVVEEKRALHEITQSRRIRRVIESFQADQEALETDRAAADELRKKLDDPQSKALSERYDAIKAELDALKKEGDDAHADRSKLIEERDALQDQINALFNQKRQSAQNFRDANDRYWTKVNEDRMKRAERHRAQRAAEEAEKKREATERLREEAAVPAYQSQIEDCQTLIDFFSGKSTATPSAPLSAKPDVSSVPKLELRKVEADPTDGMIARKKKGEDEDAYFVGKGKAKAKKAGAKASDTPDTSSPTSTQLHIPLPTLTALLSLSIPSPASSADVPRVVEDLKTKKAWFEANQARATAENVSKADAEIRRILNGTKDGQPNDAFHVPGTTSFDDVAVVDQPADDTQ